MVSGPLVRHDWQSKQPLSPPQTILRPDSTLDTLAGTWNSRTTTFSVQTPFRVGDFTWRNSLRVRDFEDNIPDLTKPVLTRNWAIAARHHHLHRQYSTGLDWDTGINLPPLPRQLEAPASVG
jgi:hypothetical protein